MPSERAPSLGCRGHLLCQDAQEQVPVVWVWLPCTEEQTVRTMAESMGLGNHIVSNQPTSTLVTRSAWQHAFPSPTAAS